MFIYLSFEFIRHLDPIIHGDYPELLKKQLGNRLPSFTAEQSKMLKNSSDFIGINYYTARYIAHLPHVDIKRPRFRTDQQLEWRGKMLMLISVQLFLCMTKYIF